MLSILDFHTEFHPNWTKIGKVSILGWVRGMDQKFYSGFELCPLFLTYTPNSTQHWTKNGKFSSLGWVRGVRVRGKGVGVVGLKKISLNLSFAVHLCLPH